MTTAAEPVVAGKTDVRTIVGGGAKLGAITAVGVVTFAMLSRLLAGPVEVVVQSLLVFAGLAVFAFQPAAWVRPRGIDAIAWTALMGLLGAAFFTVVDTAVLRPVKLYHWTWDQIGGGSGWWYIPIWWMGSAFLAWLGAWVVSRGGDVSPTVRAGQTVGVGVVLFAMIVMTGILPFHAGTAALAGAVGLIAMVPLVGILRGA
ncbi:MAG TPA: hypothetical protein VNL18_16015 [Gemmatimonadales bacterium]|nr:hypothetical protein [Gemmatimonadales bacterium]